MKKKPYDVPIPMEDVESIPWVTVHRIAYKGGEFVMYLRYDHNTHKISLSRNPKGTGDDYHFENSHPKVLAMFIAVAARAMEISATIHRAAGSPLHKEQ